ncbi:MAG: preprotein translocase subunit SecG [Clostridia bacterium]|nr:preprotein translocase subunit SecG [Clostridia bacterium]
MAWYSYLIGAFLILFALIIIAVVLLQEGRRKGISGVISGGADTFLSKGKARAVDAVLARWTKWVAILFGLIVVGAFVLGLVL